MRNDILAALGRYQNLLNTLKLDDERPAVSEAVRSGNVLIQLMARLIVEELREARA